VKVLVTGGAGFIGSNFIRYLLAGGGGDEIVNLDRLTYAGNPENLRDLEGHPRYRFVQGDICDGALLREVLPGTEAVVNFAAETHVDRSNLDAGEFLRTNVTGTFTLLEAVRELRVPRFLQVSTDEVYGSLERGAAAESAPLNPSNPYSASKAAADLLVRSYWSTHRVPVVITRSSNNYGPYQYPEKVIPLFVTNAIEDRPVPLYGDGKNVREWLYVLDNCAAIDLVLRRGAEGEVYNVGSGVEVQNIELTRRILALLGRPESLIRPVTDRPGHDRRYAVNCSKLTGELGWSPRREFGAAVHQALFRAGLIESDVHAVWPDSSNGAMTAPQAAKSRHLEASRAIACRNGSRTHADRSRNRGRCACVKQRARTRVRAVRLSLEMRAATPAKPNQ